ncbi:MotA/TolQ/ExbB proton channel family protein [Herbaspirillum sp. SJZ099]|uniref:MotA/TolQ/ExbB proton channel family protein n=1 Tax=Herbaspirillum sp. SJZ099 TaxID=2572916 RepID=UPI0011A1F373|nr:MotA/TolQ/ExbB proton channel family protein [Herbaspirillum sp. SJZ099]TWC67375.1 outer membrane transport energization protein ExbB [Herbaspirillum sp. SJZ099]
MNAIQLFHDLTFYAMYAAAALAVFLIVERQLFFWFGSRDAGKLLHSMSAHTHFKPQLDPAMLERKTVPVQLVREALEAHAAVSDQTRLQDLGEAIYIAGKSRVNARLWVLDTIVTAAPLLGLVGTILGIIDTFSVLASSGISDPSGVSKGIGTALYATALGISIALFGLLFYNYLRECADRLNDQLKELLLRAAGVVHGEERESQTGRPERHPMQAVG